MAQIPTIPPTGRAISGSIAMPTSGRIANSAMTTSGPAIDAQNEGSDSSFVLTFAPSAMGLLYRFDISGMMT